VSTKVVTIGGKVLKVGGKPVRVLPGGFANRYSLLFDGVDEWCKGTAGAFSWGAGLTVSFWFRTGYTGGVSQTLFRAAVSGSNPWDSYLSGGTVVCNWIGPAGVVTMNYVGGLNNGVWHHLIAAAVNGAGGRCSLAVDGVIRYVGTLPGSLYNLAAHAYFAQSRGSGSPLSGNLDEVAVWNAALSDGGGSVGSAVGGDFATVYNAGEPGDLEVQLPAHWSSMYGWWRNGDSDSTPLVIADASNNLRHMTMTNMENEDIVPVVP